MSTTSSRLIALLFCAIVLVIVALLAPDALGILAIDGLIAIAILLAGAGLGRVLLAAFPFKESPPATQWILATALGTGALSLLVLALGTAGIMARGVWITIVAAGDALAIWHLAQLKIAAKRHSPDDAEQPTPNAGPYRWMVLAYAIFLAFAILAATTPPGLLWPAEGNGYDVLEYHLGAPRAYFDAGRITYLPHNIYSNFPFNVEMLYLLSMILHSDPVRAVFTAKLVNLLLGVLAVVAVWRIGARISPTAGVIAATLVGTTPFLVYLSGVAYVENGMVFFTATALLAVLGLRESERGLHRRALAAGLLAGFAAGCKYTALPMVALPLVVFVIVEAVRVKRVRLTPLTMTAGILLALAPWFVKNLVATGNPVFPLASKWFGYKSGTWDKAGEQRWIEGHEPPESERSLAHRLDRFGDQILATKQFGPVTPIGFIALVGAGGIALFRRRGQSRTAGDSDNDVSRALRNQLTIACALLIVISVYVWLFHTHLVDRFAITLVVPCALVIAACVHQLPKHARGAIGILLVAAIALLNLATTWTMFHGPDVPWYSFSGLPTSALTSADSSVFPHVAAINRRLTGGSRVLVVGDSKGFYLNRGADCSVVFNRNPFADAAADRVPDELIKWLQDRGYAYVYVDWNEMHRLRSTYGFWRSITPKLFEALHGAGLQPEQSFTHAPNARPYATLFGVPRQPQPNDR